MIFKKAKASEQKAAKVTKRNRKKESRLSDFDDILEDEDDLPKGKDGKVVIENLFKKYTALKNS